MIIIIKKKISKAPMYTSLKQLTTFSRDFIIFVRILKKSEIKVFNTNNLNNPIDKVENFFILLY